MLPGLALGQTSQSLPEINVIATSPLGGSGIDRDKVPAMTHTLSGDDFSRTYSTSVTDTLMQRVPGVSTTDVQGNGFFQDLRYRGFAASPLQGTPQGLAVYMGGIRLNEAFGDTVNWDFIPANAIDRTDMWTNNPVFGLNALGGAVNMQMKNGFTYSGLEADLQGGSYGRANGSIQYGGQKDGVGVYFAGQGILDDGWRYQSTAQVKRGYGDIGWKGDRGEFHLVVAGASNYFGVVGPTPIQLVNLDNKAIYTWPQTTKNETGLVALNGKFDLPSNWTLQGNIYLRKFRQEHVDGNDANVERCSGNMANPLFNKLCLEDDGFPAQPKVNFQILANANQAINCPPGVGNTCATTPWGTVDRTWTNASTLGTSWQATNDTKLFGHQNHFTVGASFDYSWIKFRANSELGYIYPDLSVGPNPAIPATGAVINTTANIGYAPVSLEAHNSYYGLYATNTFDITSRLSFTAGGRLNVARIEMQDQLGTSPDLNRSHNFSRFNPLTGVTYKLFPDVTAYAGYSESNRAPTPLELGCSNPLKPCLLEGFLVSDPPLKQVVSRTYEAGLRGERALNEGRLAWKFGLFRTDTQDEIINVASSIQGRGVFQNIEGTRRQGIEASTQYTSAALLAYATYSYIDATYRFTGDIPSPNNPSADGNGNIHVTPGKRMPGIPQHQFKAGIEYAMTSKWRVGVNVVVVGNQYYVGDDANQNDKLPAYSVTNLYSSYQFSKEVQLFGLVNNLFNQRYATYGTYFDPQSVVNAIPNAPTDHRTVTQAQPLSVYAGLRVRL